MDLLILYVEYLYHLMNNQYVELIVGHGLRDCEIAFDSHVYGEIHQVVVHAIWAASWDNQPRWETNCYIFFITKKVNYY